MHDSYPRLLADIGGTNARFGLQMAADQAVGQVRQLPVAGFAGPAEAAEAYLAELAAEPGLPLPARPRWAALAVATAVGADRVAFTNSHWDFSCTDVRHALGLDGLLVLNDFEALALSLPRLGAGQLRCADGPLPQPQGTLAVVGPGTGLGVGGVAHTRSGWVALPGEGGHATLAAADDLDSAVLAVVRRQFPHVSAERLLSGIGLPLLHGALATVRGEPAQPLDTATIVTQGGDGRCALCSATLDLFCALLGSFAGNVALTLGARGGLYIGGGIVPRFADRFFASDFRRRFEAKGRFQAYLQAIPTPLITDTLAALSGTALAIDQAVAAQR
ncbi:MAG: glucokinase [Burkholderiales bacterium PBB5]|nr:MAG: glucokinase [Burkholderiales bacterium PBB5]